MKASSSTGSRSAFTLVELLVVIGIIVILMGLLLGAIPAVKEAARKTEAKQTVQAIAVAANAYYTEYAKFPPVEDPNSPKPPGTVIKDTVVGDPIYNAENPNNTLFFTLRNIPKGPNENSALNPRKVVFYDGKGATVSASNQPRSGFYDKTSQGAAPEETKDGCLYDPWGVQYGVIMDTTGDERIDLENFYTDFSNDDPQSGKAARKRAGAFSVGKDGQLGKKGDKLFRNGTETSDDVISFE
jgi:prepilin-type N-terminal cleavage/methylation domain-containing protein